MRKYVKRMLIFVFVLSGIVIVSYGGQKLYNYLDIFNKAEEDKW